ncbi:MAG: hypothetical protein CMN54_08205 [SAR324 cluster bacterium]|uniref:Uncharacterized protein n=1 Tax=SAR324 cluster bacterium TaxID=2024889 RepID=A0A2D6YJQ8_9DELT|nr:hypothetical protein [SAR324 cluster bacterium]
MFFQLGQAQTSLLQISLCQTGCGKICYLKMVSRKIYLLQVSSCQIGKTSDLLSEDWHLANPNRPD